MEPFGGVQPTGRGLRAAQDGWECGPTLNCTFTSNIVRFFFVITCHSVFDAWPKTALLPVWPGAKRLGTP